MRLERLTPPERRMANTAAASVDPTILPSSIPSSQEMSRIHAAANPVTTAVTSTPKVASTIDGFQEIRGHPVLVGSSAKSRDEDIQRRLWTVSEELTGVTFPV